MILSPVDDIGSAVAAARQKPASDGIQDARTDIRFPCRPLQTRSARSNNRCPSAPDNDTSHAHICLSSLTSELPPIEKTE